MTVKEAALALGVSVARVRQLIASGLVRTKRFGKVHMVYPSSVQTAMTRRRPGWPKGKKRKP